MFKSKPSALISWFSFIIPIAACSISLLSHFVTLDRISWEAYAIVSLYAISFFLGILLISGKVAKSGIPFIVLRKRSAIIILISVSGIILSITGLQNASFNPADILSILNSGSVVKQIRYEREYGISLIFQTLYLSLLPFAYYFFRTSGKLWYLCLYIPLAITSLAHLTRTSLIVQFLIFGAYEAIYGNKKIKIGIILVFFLLFFFGLSGLRGDFSFDKFSTLASLLASTLSSYYLGTLVAFSNWIEMIPYSELFNFEFSGLVTLFPGVGKLLQLAGFNLPVSEYQYDSISISNYDDIYTNVFSSFRPLVEALGVFGLLIYGFLHGIISTWLIAYALEQSDSSTMIAPLAITYNLYFVVYPLFLFGYFPLSLFILFFFRASSRRRLST